MPDYVMVKAQLSPEAAEIWNDFLAQQGITLGAFLEATASLYRDGGRGLGIGAQTALKRAREIVAERRRRGRNLS